MIMEAYGALGMRGNWQANKAIGKAIIESDALVHLLCLSHSLNNTVPNNLIEG